MRKAKNTLFFTLFLWVTLYAANNSITLDELNSQTINYLHSDKKLIKVVMVDTTFPLYYAYAYMDLNSSFEKVAPKVLDFDNFENVFNSIKDVHSLKDSTRYTNENLYYIYGKTNFIDAWGIGNVTEKLFIPDSLVKVSVRPAPKKLVKKYKKKLKGKVRYYVKSVYVDAYLLKIDDTHCRVGFIGMSDTNKKMPLWLANMIIKIILPRLLNDLEE